MEIQIAALKQIPAFKDQVIYRPGYAIEYDYFDPTQLKHTLESKIIKNLFSAVAVDMRIDAGYQSLSSCFLVSGSAVHLSGKERPLSIGKKQEGSCGTNRLFRTQLFDETGIN